MTETTLKSSISREAWKVLEPYHAVIYFAPEARSAYTALGLKGYWMGYFASRAAPLGPVPPEIVTATFYNFHHQMVARAIPDAWHFSQPHLVLRARTEAADAVLQRLLGEMVDSEELREAASLAREAVNACHPAGRALFASYLALPWPEKPHMVLWHAATLLREYRGDGHVAALLTEGIDGCEAHVVMAASGKVGRETIQPHRGWTDQEWEAARQRLQERGWLDSDGALNAEGQAAREAIEDQTNRLALAPWQHLGFERTNRLLELVRPLSGRIIEQGGIPVPNPMGVPWP